MGMAVTGKSVSVYTGASLLIEDGKVKQFWQHADFIGMMMQLGLINPPSQAATA